MCVNISARLFLSSDPNSKKVRDMLEKLSEEEKLQARNVCERILLDNHQFSDRWIEESGLKLLVVESIKSFESKYFWKIDRSFHIGERPWNFSGKR